MTATNSGSPAAAPGLLPKAVVTGLGLLTPLGYSPWSTFRALLEGRTICDRDAGLAQTVDPVQLARHVGTVSVARMGAGDPAVELAERAARQACQEAGVDPLGLETIVASSKGAVTALESAILDRMADQAPQRMPLILAARQLQMGNRDTGFAAEGMRCRDALVLGPHGYLASMLMRRLGVRVVATVVSACASGLTALDLARRMLVCRPPSQQPSRILVVAAEASLLPLFIHSYRRLGVLAPLRPGEYRALPLDEGRRGFVLTETSAAMLLERAQSVGHDRIEIVDTATACDAHDMVRPSPTMDAIRHVSRRLLGRGPVDVLHPHAPGTIDHDELEMATHRALAGPACDVYACKGALGHGLGAAGLVAAVVACLCAMSGRRPPMPWLRRPIAAVRPEADRSDRPERAAEPQAADRTPRIHPPPRTHAPPQTHIPQRTHAVFAGGFGGHAAGALLRRGYSSGS
jgi:3-oxoacyl-[acyl-carrier-protein] synthase II